MNKKSTSQQDTTTHNMAIPNPFDGSPNPFKGMPDGMMDDIKSLYERDDGDVDDLSDLLEVKQTSKSKRLP